MHVVTHTHTHARTDTHTRTPCASEKNSVGVCYATFTGEDRYSLANPADAPELTSRLFVCILLCALCVCLCTVCVGVCACVCQESSAPQKNQTENQHRVSVTPHRRHCHGVPGHRGQGDKSGGSAPEIAAAGIC